MSSREKVASLRRPKVGVKARRKPAAGVASLAAKAKSARRGQRLPGTTSRTGGAVPEPVTTETLKSRALEVFGSDGKAEHWLHRPNWLFQGRTPLQTVQTDPPSVEAELVRIEHGVYI